MTKRKSGSALADAVQAQLDQRNGVTPADDTWQTGGRAPDVVAAPPAPARAQVIQVAAGQVAVTEIQDIADARLSNLAEIRAIENRKKARVDAKQAKEAAEEAERQLIVDDERQLIERRKQQGELDVQAELKRYFSPVGAYGFAQAQGRELLEMLNHQAQRREPLDIGRIRAKIKQLDDACDAARNVRQRAADDYWHSLPPEPPDPWANPYASNVRVGGPNTLKASGARARFTRPDRPLQIMQPWALALFNNADADNENDARQAIFWGIYRAAPGTLQVIDDD